jgi:hypothetical protein
VAHDWMLLEAHAVAAHSWMLLEAAVAVVVAHPY